jgi:hypothetical protein
MKYVDGTIAKIGDLVRLNHDEEAEVVALIAETQARSDIKIEEWQYLNDGVLIESRKYGLFHFQELGNDVEFLARASKERG